MFNKSCLFALVVLCMTGCTNPALENLLKNDPSVKLTKVVFDVGGMTQEITDAKSVAYLNTAFRSSQREGHYEKRDVHCDVILDTNQGTIRCRGHFNRMKSLLIVDIPAKLPFHEEDSYLVDLNGELPENIRTLKSRFAE